MAKDLIENLKGGIKKALISTIDKSEEILIQINGQMGEAVVVTNERVIILKAGFASGALVGKKASSYYYHQITSIEISYALTVGRLEISVAGASKSPGMDFADARKLENVVNFYKKDKPKFEAAARKIRELVKNSQTPTQTPAQQTDVVEEIRKLASLRDDGLITDEEFEAKKKQILGI